MRGASAWDCRSWAALIGCLALVNFSCENRTKSKLGIETNTLFNTYIYFYYIRM
jgi:hypothetical protein